jgi:hypothetical protein
MLHKQPVFALFRTELETHNLQAPALVDPTGEIELPAPQLLHRPVPRASLYVPPGHVEQLPSVAVNPILQKQPVFLSSGPIFNAHGMQSFALVDSVGEIELPVPQILHKAFPVTSLYFPVSHAEQLPGVPVNPMLHKQVVFAVSGAEFDAHLCTADAVQELEALLVIYPTSITHELLQPSLFAELPSSHASSLARMLSPHCDVHASAAFDTSLHSNPHSTEQVVEHPSPEVVSLSSHVSVSRRTPSPHTACGDGKCGAG